MTPLLALQTFPPPRHLPTLVIWMAPLPLTQVLSTSFDPRSTSQKRHSRGLNHRQESNCSTDLMRRLSSSLFISVFQWQVVPAPLIYFFVYLWKKYLCCYFLIILFSVLPISFLPWRQDIALFLTHTRTHTHARASTQSTLLIHLWCW